MPKVPTVTEKPKVLDVLIDITDQALDFRFPEKPPKLIDIGKVVIAASRALHIKDGAEREQCENAAVMAIARKRQLVS
jgi:hypothetical protein